MSKYRIYELAKEFNTTSKVVLDILARNNHATAKNHMSSVGDEEKSIIQHVFAGNKKEAAPQAANKPPVQQKTSSENNDQRKNAMNTTNRPKTENKPNSNPTGGHASAGNRPAGQRPNKPSEGQARPPQQHNRPNTNTNQTHATSGNRTGTSTSSNRPANGTSSNRPATTTNSSRPATNNSTTAPNRSNATKRPQGGFNQNRGPAKPGSSSDGFHHNNRGGNRNSRYNRNNRNQSVPAAPKQEIARPKLIKIGESIAVKDLASKMSYTATDIIKKLMKMGVMATINQEIDFDTATLVAGEFEVTVEALPPEQDPTEIPEIEDDPKSLVLRPPVVTVMGHVDHGKTSLLDVIRKTSVTSHEAGGITQHIGAYQVMCQGKKIVFLDTPGHEAFTAMRARGAQVTDVAILVVAADDGVMPQTIEAINHAKSANVPIIVAINKIDKPGANPDHVKQQLSEYELIPEEWGGDTVMVPVSAKQKLGISELLEMILLVAEVQELKANPNRDARGIIIEAQLDKGRGPVATVLVQNGTLRIGDSILAGTAHGKVRAMINDRGEKIKKAGPSVPVEVLGLADVPEAGDILAALDEKLARSISDKRIEKQRTELIHSKKVSLDDLFQQIKDGDIKDLNILIKADVQGSVGALSTSLLSLNNKSDEVRVNIIHSGVGAVNESDVMLATAANALILAFNVRPDANARRIADSENIDIRTYRVIYEAINDVEAAMTGMLAPQYKEVIQGKVEIRQVMKFSKALVAGSYVLEGKITNSSQIRIIRDNIVVHDGVIESLRRFKDDVKEVAAGYECGITIENYKDYKDGDILEAYIMEEVKPKSI